jgi:hypothetical protein
MKQERPAATYAERETRLSLGARHLLEETWAILAKRFRPDVPEAEAIAAFKELHAARTDRAGLR